MDGHTIPFTAPYDVPAGGGALVGSMFVVAIAAVLSGGSGQGRTVGVIDMAKATGQAWTQGVKLYWDNTAKNLTTTAGGNTLVGVAAQAQASGDTVGRIKLGIVA
jgi:predicted RecA/RadA family phage recombinase